MNPRSQIKYFKLMKLKNLWKWILQTMKKINRMMKKKKNNESFIYDAI